jgi:hypothetical protein
MSKQQRLVLTLVAVYSAATLLAASAPILLFASSTAAYADNGNGWPKAVKYKPRSEEGQTGLTIAQCDSPQQCKEVNGTPSPNLAAKKQCEEFSGEKCKKVKQ